MFRIENITKRYKGGCEPISSLNAVIKKGEVISIIGPSGTGKTTLLKCLNMLDPPTSGDIYYKGERITEKGYDIYKLRQKVGMVFQSFNLFDHITVIENIMLPQVKLLKKSRQEAYEEGMKLLSMVGLEDCYLRYPKQLSGGQKQRVAIARAMSMDPEVLLMDEPTSALDPSMVDEVNAVIKNLVASGMTLLIVTHDMAFARDISSRIFYMDEGIIYEEGTVNDIFENPKKPKTIQFIKKLFVIEEDIYNRNYDFSGFTQRIYELMLKVRTYGNVWNNAVLLLDELIHNVLFLILGDSFRIHIKLECRKKGIVIGIEYSGEEFDLSEYIIEKSKTAVGTEYIDDWMPISARLIVGYSQNITYSKQDGELKNAIQITVGEGVKDTHVNM